MTQSLVWYALTDTMGKFTIYLLRMLACSNVEIVYPNTLNNFLKVMRSPIKSLPHNYNTNHICISVHVCYCCNLHNEVRSAQLSPDFQT